MSSGSVAMLSGAGVAILGGALLWRGWSRYADCVENPPEDYLVCDRTNAPTAAGVILAPLGFATFLVGGAVALIQSEAKKG